jgi:hypothetical protein
MVRQIFNVAPLRTTALTLGMVFANAVAFAMPVTYSYEGVNYTAITDDAGLEGEYTTDHSLTGQFTLGGALGSDLTHSVVAPLSFSFSDGRHTLTEATADLFDVHFQFSTDGSGLITDWLIVVSAFTSDGSGLKSLVTSNFLFGGAFDSGLLSMCDGSEFVDGGCAGGDLMIDQGTNLGVEGTWGSQLNPISEPPTLLLALGALLFGLSRRGAARPIGG